MFAAHTPTRMKGSGVVKSLNWKALADKIHPNSATPLTTKESSRLLTALTGSFRKHLDEVHPVATENRPKSGKNGGSTTKTSINALHSSAAFAQRHMTSVLTNPLLVNGADRLDYGSAKAELQKNASKDPISLLEEYDEKGAATIRIAVLCLDKAKQEYDTLATKHRSKYLIDTQAGRRVFLWLLRSGNHESSTFAENKQFMNLMSFFLIKEGREDNLWQCLKLDFKHDDPTVSYRYGVQKMLHSYRWRGRLLRSMADVKLGTMDHPKSILTTDKLHAVLDMYFAAVDLKLSTVQKFWFPLAAITPLVMDSLATIRRDDPKIHVDVERYEKFQKLVTLSSHNKLYGLLAEARLDVVHPTNPNPDKALEAFKEIRSESELAKTFLPRIRDGKHESEEHRVWYNLASRAVYLLRNQQRETEAAWLTDVIHEEFPARAKYLEIDCNEMATGQRRFSLSPIKTQAESEAEREAPARIPVPSFV